MRAAVLGSTGMAGHMIALYLEEKGFDVFRISRSEKDTEKSKAIDAAKFQELADYLDSIHCDVIINCIGLLQKACEERHDLAVLINSYLPHYLEEKYKDSKTRIVHLSTDCVFSGDRGGYLETDLPDGRSYYDRTKALGEIINNKDLTFRMSVIGPDIDENGTGLLNWFMKQTGTVYGYTNVIWNGITTLQLAKCIIPALTNNVTGLYHLVPDAGICKYDLLSMFNEKLRQNRIKIVGRESDRLNRTLVNTHRNFIFDIADYQNQMNDLNAWMKEHSRIYPRYYVT